MLFYLFIGFASLCVITFIGMSVIFYKGMKVNQLDMKNKSKMMPQASRPAPRMEQQAAIDAKMYHVLPVITGDIIYSAEKIYRERPKGEDHFVATHNKSGQLIWRTLFHSVSYQTSLETDVQSIFVVDLYVREDEVIVKLEHREPVHLNKGTGEIVVPRL